MDIGKRLKDLREERGLTLEQVGNYIGVNKATVQRYETGNIDIRRTTAIKLAEVLQSNPSYIMGWIDSDLPVDAQKGKTCMGIGYRLREARKQKKLTQEQLAEKVDVTKGAIANYENMVSMPKKEILLRLMQVLEVDANYIYQDDIKIPSQPIVVQSDLSIMSVQESLHLEKYRKLNTSGRQKADEQLDDLLLIAKYTEKDQSNIERDTAV